MKWSPPLPADSAPAIPARVDFAMLRTVIAARQQTCATVRALAAIDGGACGVADHSYDASAEALRQFAGHGAAHANAHRNGAFSPYAPAPRGHVEASSLPFACDGLPRGEGKNHA